MVFSFAYVCRALTGGEVPRGDFTKALSSWSTTLSSSPCWPDFALLLSPEAPFDDLGAARVLILYFVIDLSTGHRFLK